MVTIFCGFFGLKKWIEKEITIFFGKTRHTLENKKLMGKKGKKRKTQHVQ